MTQHRELPEVEIKIDALGQSTYRGVNDPEALNLFYCMADRHAERHKPDWMKSARLVWGQDRLALCVFSILSLTFVLCFKTLLSPISPTPLPSSAVQQQVTRHDL